MLTDMIVEEEFEIKEEEPWYDKQDLEHDLQLAAELGKTLLERNRELEQGLQQMYATNQDQLQEIEYLTKQVDLLRQVNDQHAKVYEQLDVSARELEQSNQKLAQDNKKAKQKINGLGETVDLLQTQVEELQHQVEELKLSPGHPQKPPVREKRPPRSSQSVSCLQELRNSLRNDSNGSNKCSGDVESSATSWREEEQASLQQSLRGLQAQFAAERARREEAEREAELLARENSALEQQLAALEGCRARLSELEHEAEELRQLWKSSSRSAGPDFVHGLLPHSLFLNPEEEGAVEPAAKAPAVLKRCASERLMKATTPAPDSPDRISDHECSCVRRAGVVTYRGISLLNEVDAQYSALQVKYEALVRHCQLGGAEEEEEEEEEENEEDTQSHKSSTAHQPEYKELFKQIFSRIRKTKEDLMENRGRSSEML